MTDRDDEFRAFITALYREELGREPDPLGLASWLEQAREGMTGDEMRRLFRASPEGIAHRGGEPPPIEPPSGQPSPSGSSRVIQLTSAADGLVRPVGMSYWPNINHHANRDELHVLVSLADVLTLFVVDKASLTVRRKLSLPFFSTGEGCYFSFTDPDRLYVPQSLGLIAFNVAIGSSELVVDVADARQFHSSADGHVHSFSIGNSAAVLAPDRLRTFPARGAYDECQIDKSGRWLVIKEGSDNRIVDLYTEREWTITDTARALGHSDCGYGYMVGEEDRSDPGGVFRRWRFTEQGPVDDGVVYAWGGWSNRTRYVSHCNAQPGAPDGQRLLFSDSFDGLTVVTMGQEDARIVCPSFTDLNAPGGGEVYWRLTRANLDPIGQFAAFSGNHSSDRMDVFLVEVN